MAIKISSHYRLINHETASPISHWKGAHMKTGREQNERCFIVYLEVQQNRLFRSFCFYSPSMRLNSTLKPFASHLYCLRVYIITSFLCQLAHVSAVTSFKFPLHCTLPNESIVYKWTSVVVHRPPFTVATLDPKSHLAQAIQSFSPISTLNIFFLSLYDSAPIKYFRIRSQFEQRTCRRQPNTHIIQFQNVPKTHFITDALSSYSCITCFGYV